MIHLGATVPYDTEQLQFAKQMGVEIVDVTPTQNVGLETDGYWHADALCRVREQVEAAGLRLGAMHLPLTSAGIERQLWPGIMRGTPERDRELEQVARCIRAAATAGVPTLLYNLAILPVVRTRARTPGRGGLGYSHFDYATLAADPPHPDAPLSPEQAWERIDYFVQRIIPVAEEYRVRLGCHQHDPGMPPGRGYRGIERVLGSIEGVQRFIGLHPSPYHGLNFCQGTIAEMCAEPEQVYEAIRYFGGCQRIFWVHFRNIRGGFLNFDEVLPDEGSVDMVQALLTYLEVGYDGVLDPDHVPASSLDTPYGHRARAFCYGYIRGLLQALGQ